LSFDVAPHAANQDQAVHNSRGRSPVRNTTATASAAVLESQFSETPVRPPTSRSSSGNAGLAVPRKCFSPMIVSAGVRRGPSE
jgi:hypothetical protein